MVPLYVFLTKIYHFPASQLQFAQIINLKPIDSEFNMQEPFVSSDVAGLKGYFAD
jgi:hypothetical protein